MFQVVQKENIQMAQNVKVAQILIIYALLALLPINVTHVLTTGWLMGIHVFKTVQ